MLLFMKYSEIRTEGCFNNLGLRGRGAGKNYSLGATLNHLFSSTLPAQLCFGPPRSLFAKAGSVPLGCSVWLRVPSPWRSQARPGAEDSLLCAWLHAGPALSAFPPTSARRLERPELGKWAGHVTVASGVGERFQAPRNRPALRSVDFSTFASFSVALPLLPYRASCGFGFFAF